MEGCPLRKLLDARLLLVLIVSFTFISAEVNRFYPISLPDRLKQGKPANILLIGVDARPGEAQTRSDVLILLSLNRAVNKAALVSIPRDTRVVFEGRNRKINMINQLEGPEATCREVGRLLDIPVNHYIITNFSGFEDIVDSLGGVYMNVDIRLHSYRAGVYLEKGPQWLSGKEALAYVRFRANPDMDIGRTRRQQELLQALARQLTQKENIVHLPGLISRCSKYVTTNISTKEMLYLPNTAVCFKENNIITQTLPGYHYFASGTGASFWEADPEIAASLLDSLFEGHRYEVIQPAPPWVRSW